MKSGAFDFVLKPFAIEDMEAKVQAALASRDMPRNGEYLTPPGTTAANASGSARWAR